ncbi:MAG: gfo/Idh/MocA family oxidoreductase, partial [Bacteroidota bacterium]|nr:gfo/Idh/MocA family oxidoreductase [Bacteroidota bacterium]
IRGFDIRKELENGNVEYPGRYIEMLWDAENMRVTNFEEANQFVKRNYREGWKL